MTEQFKYSFFPFCINEWNKLDNMMKKSVNIKCFKSMLMKFFSLQERSIFSIHDPPGAKLLTRLWLKFGHLNKDKFCYDFKNSVVTMCDFFVTERQKPLKNVYDKHFSSQNLNEESIIDILLYGWDKFNEHDNKEILLHTVDYYKSTKCLERPLIGHCLL